MSKIPVLLDEQKGHLTKKEKKIKKESEELLKSIGNEDLEKLADFLINNKAQKEYRRVVGNLAKIDVIGNLDKNNIVLYSNAVAGYTAISLKIKELIKEGTYKWMITIYVGDKPREVINPLAVAQKYYADEIVSYGPLIGISLNSRFKVVTEKVLKLEEGVMGDFPEL